MVRNPVYKNEERNHIAYDLLYQAEDTVVVVLNYKTQAKATQNACVFATMTVTPIMDLNCLGFRLIVRCCFGRF